MFLLKFSVDIDEALKYDVVMLPKDQDQKSSRLVSQKVDEAPSCVLCEFVMTKLESVLQNKTEEDEIKKALLTICNHLPGTVRKQCDSFIEGYADAIINLISNVPAKEICQKLQLCFSQAVNDEVVGCGVCHGISQALLPFFRSQKEHNNISAQDMISLACENLPAKYYNIVS